MEKPRLFAVMPFGIRPVAHALDTTLDFDRLYREYLREAAAAADWDIFRIDDSPEPGPIADQYLRELATADLVIGDISIPNANVYYELGIRHSVSPGGTLLIAHENSSIPFDLAGQRIFFYQNSVEGLNRLTSAITSALKEHAVGKTLSPVYTYFERTGIVPSPSQDSASFEREIESRIERAESPDQLIGLWEWLKAQTPLPPVVLYSIGDRLASFERWEVAAAVFRVAVETRKDDFQLHRQLAWCLSHLEPTTTEETTFHFEAALRLNPRDPETLGMMASRFKRQRRFQDSYKYFDEAVLVSQQSIYLEVNRAACRIFATPNAPDEGLGIYAALKTNILRIEDRPLDEWDELVLCECCFAAGEEGEAFTHCRAALSLSSGPKGLLSAARQFQIFADLGYRAPFARELINRLRGAIRQSPELEGTKSSVKPDSVRPVLIHLSDVHFGGLSKDGSVEQKHRFFDGVNERSLIDHFRDELTLPTSPINFPVEQMHLICSGDFTYVGSKAEFEEALSFLNGFTESAKLPKSRVHIIPGNHDINWALGRSDPSQRFDNYLGFVHSFYGEALAQERLPLIKWPVRLGDQRPNPWDIIYFCPCPEHEMLVVGLNTCVYENEQHHFGFVGERQLKSLRKRIVDARYPREWLKVLIMHHHLHAMPELLKPRANDEPWLDMSILRDAGLVEMYLAELGIDVVLHGHKHKPILREVTLRDTTVPPTPRRPLVTCGAGSVGCNELEHAEPNQYQIIEAIRIPRAKDAEFLRVSWRILPVKPGAEWTTSNVFSVLG